MDSPIGPRSTSTLGEDVNTGVPVFSLAYTGRCQGQSVRLTEYSTKYCEIVAYRY